MIFRQLVSIASLALASMSIACGWDNDTLAAESKGIPELIDALVGRIAIYPKEYYEFRIARSSKIVASDPTNLEELDNLIVAYDKVGDYQKSLASANLKLKALNAKPNKEHEYRYYANLGTIEAHEWIRRTDHADKSLLDQSIKDLKKCIEINPDAHFGREIVQVKLIEMMRDEDEPSMPGDIDPTKVERLDHLDAWLEFVKATGEAKVQKGIIGIMSLGSGPDSPDLLCAIIPTMDKKLGTVREVADRRLADLLPSKPMFAGIGAEYGYHHPRDSQLFNQQYLALVASTDEYRKALKAYVLEKLATGSHPDVDPKFWADWKEPSKPNLRSLEPLLTPNQRTYLAIFGLFSGVALAVVAASKGLKWLDRKFSKPKPR